jgi:hypothetical protein
LESADYYTGGILSEKFEIDVDGTKWCEWEISPDLLQDGWNDDYTLYTLSLEFRVLVSIGYDGVVLIFLMRRTSIRKVETMWPRW